MQRKRRRRDWINWSMGFAIVMFQLMLCIGLIYLDQKSIRLEAEKERAVGAFEFERSEHQKTMKAFANGIKEKNAEIKQMQNDMTEIKAQMAQLQKQNDELKKNIALSKANKAATDKAVRAANLPSRSGPRVGGKFTVSATAYTPYCKGCSGRTATGINVREGRHQIIAVDPKFIPLNRRWHMWVNGEYKGVWLSADTGGAIKGMKVDVLHYSEQAAINFGRRTIELAPAN